MSVSMSQTPTTVRIKRKKEDEPVDALYVQTEHGQKRRRYTDFVFTRVLDHDDNRLAETSPTSPTVKIPVPNRPTKRAVSNFQASGIPVVRTTKPGEEDGLGIATSEEYRKKEKNLVSSKEQDVSSPASKALLQKLVVVDKKLSSTASTPGRLTPNINMARRYHLTKSASSPSFPKSPASGSIRRNRKSKNGKVDVAVFMEKVIQVRSSASAVSLASSTSSGLEMTPYTDRTIAPAPRKRPNISSAEKRRKEATQSRTPPTEDATIYSEQLTNELAKFALSEISKQHVVQSRKPLKQKPNPLAARPPAPVTPEIDITSDQDSEDESGYVYDSYIRRPLPAPFPTSNTKKAEESIDAEQDPMDTDIILPIPDGLRSYGFLIIDDESKEDWEAFAMEELSDSERGDSEDEDSNAENHYANDYPEEEVSSSDEHNLGGYGSKNDQYGSDDEDYVDDDGDDAMWSDGEDADKIRQPSGWKTAFYQRHLDD